MRWNKIFLTVILFIAIMLRFFNLGTNPPSLTWDEVAWGYNAYSLGLDGRDEFGKLLPIAYLESFGDFKPPLYAYLGIIPVKIFGLSEFATRVPSALFGFFSVLLTYFFVLEIFGQGKKKLAILSTFLMAISPWHIMLSRAAFEANVAHFFVLLGIVLFLASIRKNSYLLVFSSLSFVASMYTFNTARIVVPILLLILLAVYHKAIIKKWKVTLAAGIICFITLLPLFIFLRTPQAQLRFNEVNIFSDSSIIARINQQVENDGNSIYSRIIHNRRFAYGVEYLRHYLDNLSPQFLFIKGDGNPKFSIQDVGQLYLWEIPFLIAGFLILFRKRKGKWWIIPVLITVGIIPAGFARETPHALRIENTLPAFQVVTAIGVFGFVSLFVKKWKKVAAVSLSVIVAGNFIYFIHNYFTHYPREFSGEWQYGYKEAIAFVKKKAPEYNAVYITKTLGRPYIYYLFYTKYDPQKFRLESDVYREVLGFVHVKRIANIYFTDEIEKVTDKDTLYISTPGEKPDDGRVLKEFKLLNGNVALIAYTL